MNNLPYPNNSQHPMPSESNYSRLDNDIFDSDNPAYTSYREPISVGSSESDESELSDTTTSHCLNCAEVTAPATITFQGCNHTSCRECAEWLYWAAWTDPNSLPSSLVCPQCDGVVTDLCEDIAEVVVCSVGHTVREHNRVVDPVGWTPVWAWVAKGSAYLRLCLRVKLLVAGLGLRGVFCRDGWRVEETGSTRNAAVGDEEFSVLVAELLSSFGGED